MLIKFDKIKEVSIHGLNGGDGSVSAKMFIDQNGKILISRLPSGASIGIHRHETNSEINYVLSGNGKSICDGQEEKLTAGSCEYCPKGSSHSIINDGNEDLFLFTVVSEK
ncbi:MAG: cupin domain-containing protein [Ruminococcus sp.]|nr:cupin domain-containing protein [Ruminococcus sp.]